MVVPSVHSSADGRLCYGAVALPSAGGRREEAGGAIGWSSEGDAALPIALVGVNCAHGLLPSLQNRRAELLLWLIG